ncbi:MAG: sensor histidine kinase [Pseudomonadota bacterium]|nr:sensor histidine kinase [Pseudomonadota bacterium]
MSTPISKTDGPGAFNDEVANAAARLHREQTEVNQALVQKIFQCTQAEEALRVSESNLHALLADQFSKREDERRRIAQEIHDTLGQNLLALRLDASALHQRTGPSRLHNRVRAALANLDDTIASVKQLIADLRPFELELGLQATLEWEIKRFERSTGIRCSAPNLAALQDVVIDEGQLLTLYRVVQECLGNIAQHAGASKVDVNVHADQQQLTMCVIDNGVGIGPSHTPRFGLMGMRERLVDAGGSFTLAQSAPAAPFGTAVTITIPLACAIKHHQM